MTCSKRFGRLLQASCLGLIGALTVVGCGGSESKPTGDGGKLDGGDAGPPLATLNVDRSTVNLGTLDVNQPGVGTVTVTNTGKAESGIITITPSAGVTATGCTGKLAVAASCTLTITGVGTVPGTFSGSVSIAANPGTGTQPLLVAVVATITPNNMFTVTPATVELGPVPVGVPGPKSTLTVKALVALTDLQVSTSGADIVVDKAASTCTATPVLAAGATCVVVVNFTAASSGAKSDTVTISAGGAQGKTVNVPISATAQRPPVLVISPSTTQNFAATLGQSSTPITFGVANAGDVQTGSLTVAVAGANAADFTTTSNCLILAPLATCTVSVTFKPTAGPTEAATLTVTDTGLGASFVSVPLTGTVYTSQLEITPTAGDLGAVRVGETGTAVAFTVTNKGGTNTGAMTTGVSSAEFVIANDTCTGLSLAPAATCNVSVALKPTSVGPKSAILTVSGASGVTVGKTVTGTGITPPKLTATPASLDFAGVRVNKTGTAQTVTVKNEGGSNTGVLAFTKGGNFGVFPISANTCSAALGPNATCTFTVNFAPTKAQSETATYTITDGITSATVATSGTGLAPSGITIDPSGLIKSCQTAAAGAPCLNDSVVGGTSAALEFTVTADQLVPGSGLTDTGAVTVALAGTNAADYKIDAAKTTCGPALLPANTCKIFVSFSPTVAGSLQASLNVTTANGGSVSVTLQNKGLAMIEIEPVAITGGAEAGLSFGQVTLLGNETTRHQYKVHVRGPNASTTANTSSVVTTLTDPSQPADFSYGTTQLTNPCNGADNQAVLLNFGNGSITPAPNPTPVALPTAAGRKSAQWTFTGGVLAEFACDFIVEFYPQSSKGAKTATITTTGSGNSSDSKDLTGTATGAIKFDPDIADFGSNFLVGDSTNSTATLSGVTLSGPDITVTLKNGSQTQSFGPVSITLGGANADQFWIVADTCSTATLSPTAAACYISVAFAPTSVGAKTATLTANAGGETAAMTLTGGATTGFDITITPDQYDPTAKNVHDFGTVPQTGAKAAGWTAFTITNPAGSPRSAQVQYSLAPLPEGAGTSPFLLADGSNAGGALHHEYGTCGGTGTTTLAPGASCTFFVQFNPGKADPVTTTEAMTRMIVATDVAKGTTVTVLGSGKVGSVISISPASTEAAPFAFPDTAETVTSANSTFVVTNNGSEAVTLVAPVSPITPFNVVQGTGCTAGATLAAGQSCNLLVNFVGVQGNADATDPVSKVAMTINATGFAASDVVSYLSGKTIAPAKLEAVGYNNAAAAFSYNVNMGGVRFGSQSAPVTIRFKNVGSEATDALHYRWGSQNADDTADSEFVIQSEAADGCVGKTTLAAGAECTVTVYFKPNSGKAAGARTASFALSATSKGGLVQLFTFNAQALAAASGWIGIAGGANGFFAFPGKTAIGATATKQVFTITNNTGSQQALTLGPIGDATTDFQIIANDVSPCALTATTLDNSASCTFAVVFHPQGPWAKSTAFRLGTITAGTAAAFAGTSLGLIGQVQSPAELTITPSADQDLKQVLVGQSVPTAFTVKNIGETDSKALTLAMDAGATHYAITPGTCTGVLAAGASCSGTVTFAAGTTPNTTVPTGALVGTLTVGQEGVTVPAGEELTLTFTAYAAAQTLLGMSLTSGGAPVATLAFGSATAARAVGTTSDTTPVFVSNAANAKTTGLFTLNLVDKVNFSIDPDPTVTTCPLASDPKAKVGIAGGTDCQVGIKFSPATLPANGTFQTTLTISEAGGAAPVVLTITGYAKSALSVTTATPIVVAGGIDAPVAITFTLATGAPDTGYLKTSLTGANFMVVQDECLMTKLSSGQSCNIYVAFLGTKPPAAPNQTATLSVNGGSAGASASATLNSITPPS